MLIVAGAIILALIVIGSLNQPAQRQVPASPAASQGPSDNAATPPAASIGPTPAPTAVPTPAPTPAPPAAPVVLLDMTGNGIKTSPRFVAPSDWTIEYSYNCTSFGFNGNFAIMVEGDTFDVAANALGMKGQDVANEHSGGNVYLSINSECTWHVVAKG